MDRQTVKIYLFYCANSFSRIELTQGISQKDIEIKAISLPCSGKLDMLYLTKAFDTGADGAAVVICKKGECRHLEGNLRARRRVDAVGALLEEAGLGTGRITVIQPVDDDIHHLIGSINSFCNVIKKMSQKETPALQTAGIS